MNERKLGGAYYSKGNVICSVVKTLRKMGAVDKGLGTFEILSSPFFECIDDSLSILELVVGLNAIIDIEEEEVSKIYLELDESSTVLSFINQVCKIKRIPLDQ